jgi:predicted nucleic acid-binding protein
MIKPVIVDTNILFSALLRSGKHLRERFTDSNYIFYAPNFLFVEIFKHKGRLLENTDASEAEVLEYLNLILRNLNFVSEEEISTGNLIHAHCLCAAVDEDDTPFVALTLEMEAELWSRDKELKTHLKKNGFDSFFEE